MRVKALLVVSLLTLTANSLSAADTLPLGISISNDPMSKSASMPMQVVLLLTSLTLLPAIFMCVTPFLRVTLVLHFLRQALATQTVPSNQVLIGLSLFLTLIVMHPVLNEIYTQAWQPMEAGKLSAEQAMDEGSKPLKRFLLKFAREKDVHLFIELSHSPRPANPNQVSLTVLIPSYIISELRTGFQMGTILYLPFLVIDLVVASITLSLGMMQLPPAMLSAPFKILLFVLVDGWDLVIGSLMRSFG